MLTGLKCSGEEEEPEEDIENQYYTWDLLEGSHMLQDVEKQLRETDEDSSDERFCLAMLLLIESILLQKSKNNEFPFGLCEESTEYRCPDEVSMGKRSL